MSYRKVQASEFGVEPAYVKGMERHGLCYFIWHDCVLIGAQCAHCHTVVWVNSRINKILSEKRPDDVSVSGPDYTKYYYDNNRRFLASLPPCPECGSENFDRFINNVEFPRLADGTPFPKGERGLDVVYIDNTQIPIWLYEED